MEKWLTKRERNEEDKENYCDEMVEQVSDPREPQAQCSRTEVDKVPTKKVKRRNTFLDSWFKEDNFKGWLKKSRDMKNGNELAFCIVCKINITAHRNDITRHMKSNRHQYACKQIQICKKITSNFSKNVELSVRRAELKLSSLLAVNNLPFSLMNTLTSLCADIFSDSETAKKMSVRRTKATKIITQVLGKSFSEMLHDKVRAPGKFFSLIMDETTDQSTKKQCAFTMILYDEEKYEIETNFLDMIEITSGTAAALYKCLKEMILCKSIPFENCVGFASDTTNVMVGEHNSVFSFLKKDFPSIACVKCSCHMINLSATKACLKLPRSVEDLLRNLGSHFSRSSHRQEKFREFQDFFGIEIHKILTLSQTRWLSMKACVDRVLEQYEPLKAYLRLSVFEDPSKTTDDMLATMDNKFSKIYLEFMSYVLGILTDFNIMFQSESPLLYKLKPETEKLLKTLSSNYMEMNYIRTVTNIMSTNFDNPRKFVDLEKIYLGVHANESLSILKTDPSTSQPEITKFLNSCLAFYIALTTDISKRFDFSDPLFEIICIVDPKVAQAFKIQSLQPVFSRFPFLHSFTRLQEVDSEWRAHALLNYKDHSLDPLMPAEEYWRNVFNLKNSAALNLFDNLKNVMKLLLVLPFSNASVERVFSNLKNCKTSHRNKLKTETVVALMATKDGISKEGDCVSFNPTKEMLRADIWN